MTPCEITKDLLPLYIDSTCSEDAREYVERHLSECAECRAAYDKIIAERNNSGQSAAALQRRIRRQRILIIALCVLIILAPIAYFIYDEYSTYMHWPQPARIEPIESTVSQLSDGSIYLTLEYTDDDVYITMYKTSRWHLSTPFLPNRDDGYFEDEDTLYIQPGYLPYQTKDKNLPASNRPEDFIVTTDESYAKYHHYNSQGDEMSHPYTRIVLLGSDGEQVLWQKGDQLPAADEQAEAALSRAVSRYLPQD